MSSNKSALPIVTLNGSNVAVENAAGGCCGSSGGGSCGCASNSDPSGLSGIAFGQSRSAKYWQSLDELRGEPDFTEQFLHREFPVAASEFPEGVSRRRWLQLMGASLALVGASAGCRYSEEEILPFVIRPEGRVPGETYQRATNFELAGRVYNLLVTCVDGRPLKIEPNDSHPASGGTDAYSQASILTMYDPDRSGGEEDSLVLTKGEGLRGKTSWSSFDSFGKILVNTAAKKNGGSKFGVLMSPTSSPSTVRMIKALRSKLPKATLCRYESVEGDATRAATTKLFGQPARQSLSLDSAKVVVAIQSDILGSDRNSIQASAGFAKNRNPLDGEMSQLFVVEGNYTNTGAAADSRLALRPSQMPAFLAELGRRVEAIGDGSHSHDHEDSAAADEPAFDELEPGDRLERFLDAAAHAVAEAGDHAVIVVGDALGADAVASGIEMNAKLGSLGTIQKFLPEVDGDLGELVSLGGLVDSINAGEIDTLLILGENPVFTAPGDIDLGSAIASLEHSIYLGEYDDETSVLCDWSLPRAHPLESWNDCINDSGHYGVCQPNILPVLGGRTIAETLAVMVSADHADGESIVRHTADSIGGSLSDRAWRSLLHDGYADDLTVDFIDSKPKSNGQGIDAKPSASLDVDRDDIEVILTAADGIYDGRFANNGWLQELPQSLTKLTWDNAAVMSPRTARALGEGIKHGMMIALQLGGSKVELPVYEVPGLAPGVVSVPIGYGRTRAGKVGGYVELDVPEVGIDVSPLRQSDQMQIVSGVEGRPRYSEYELATTQNHWAIDELGREETEQRSFDLVREGTLALLDKIPEFAEAKSMHVPKVGKSGSPWREPINEIEEEEPQLPQWGMSVDLTKCTGCNACVVACQSENNVPIVGREQVIKSREMHWLRVDRYFQGDEDNADVVQQPVACMHCETAPCEQVCPVAATVHTDEGINAMAYNRCIGTRYCANNCPYKVRRFNYFNYNEDVGVGYGWNAFPDAIEEAPRKLQTLALNPEVTVRGRGVMEKCTYCVQRVEKAKITARRENNGVIQDGDVVTACQAACPAKAIEFGNIADPESKVSKAHADVRSYGMLSQLNVKPRTQYLARVRNTPARLMTRAQLTDLAELKAPHHGDHGDDHGHGGDHGGDHHDGHAEDGHSHDDHAHDDHAKPHSPDEKH